MQQKLQVRVETINVYDVDVTQLCKVTLNLNIVKTLKSKETNITTRRRRSFEEMTIWISKYHKPNNNIVNNNNKNYKVPLLIN